MTIQELYQNIDGDYDQAIKVLRVEKLIDKHIRKFTQNGVVEEVVSAADSLDPTEMFEKTHALKGVCANLGLVKLSALASEICEEYRPGNERKLSDEDIRTRIQNIKEMYAHTVKGISEYENNSL